MYGNDPKGPESGANWAVYLLTNGTRTYVGSTTDVHRRLRQHNGEIRGGARSTRGGKWRLAASLTGFSNRSEACRWERILKCRARGLGKRMEAFLLVQEGKCPIRGNLPQYPVPQKLTAHFDTQIVNYIV